MATPRAGISLHKITVDKLQKIAEGRGLQNPAALIHAWIERAEAEGEISPGAPGYSCQVSGGQILIEIAGTLLPPMPAKQARMFAAIISAAAGSDDPELPFKMPAGRPVPIEWDGNTVATSRAGPGVRFVVRPDGHEGDGIKITSPLVFIHYLADDIRQTLAAH